MEENVAPLANIQEDILVEIFLILAKDMCREYDLTSDRDWDWICVTEVCRYWRAVALETPSLWSYIYTFWSATRIKRHLLLSKDSSLTAYFKDSSISHDRDAAYRNLKPVLEEMGRMRHLWIDFSYCKATNQLFPSLMQPAPRLESVTLKAPWMYGEAQFQFPLLVSPGVLKRISLYCVDFSLKPSHLSGLSSISIHHSINLSLSALHQVLEACPGLISLTLKYCNMESCVLHRSVHLPCLSDLTLESMQFSVCHCLIQSIEASNLRRCKITSVESAGPEDVSRLSTFSKLFQAGFRTKTIGIYVSGLNDIPSGKMNLYKGFDFYQDYYYISDANLEISFSQPVDLNTILLRLTEVSRSHLEDSECLDIGSPADCITVETWLRTLSASVSIRTIGIQIDNQCHGLHFLKALQTPTYEHFPLAEMPSPKLECLHIHWHLEASDLDQLIQHLEELVKTRSAYGYPIRTVIVLSWCFVPKSKEFEKLSAWVQEPVWMTLRDIYGRDVVSYQAPVQSLMDQLRMKK